MAQLTPIQLDAETIIYIESTEDINAPTISITKAEETIEVEIPLIERAMNPADFQKQAMQNFQVVQKTIRAYTTYTLNAFKQVAIANVDKVTLEFGIKIGGEAGIPYITKGTAESNLKVTVECSFDEKIDNEQQPKQ